jgi:hypothetical protein
MQHRGRAIVEVDHPIAKAAGIFALRLAGFENLLFKKDPSR